MMARYQAKAAELGVGVSTVRRWVTQAQDGPAGLVIERPARALLDRADLRWLDAARQVIARHVPRGRPVLGPLLAATGQALRGELGVVVEAGKLAGGRGRPLLPSVAAEAVVFDHGKVYLSNHVGACASGSVSRCSPPDHIRRLTSRWSGGSGRWARGCWPR